MKSILLCLLLSFLSTHSLAEESAAKALHEKVTETLLSMQGVNGVGIGGCDPETGEETDFSKDYIECLAIYTETEEAAQALLTLFPQGQKVDGVFVIVEFIGEIRAQPRMSGGN